MATAGNFRQRLGPAKALLRRALDAKPPDIDVQQAPLGNLRGRVLEFETFRDKIEARYKQIKELFDALQAVPDVVLTAEETLDFAELEDQYEDASLKVRATLRSIESRQTNEALLEEKQREQIRLQREQDDERQRKEEEHALKIKIMMEEHENRVAFESAQKKKEFELMVKEVDKRLLIQQEAAQRTGNQNGDGEKVVLPRNNSVRLPKITMPEFDGTLLEWKPFWDSFEASIDKQDIEPQTKFNYLRSLVKGSAFQAIAGLALTGENYEAAVKILKERFGSEDMIIQGHYRALADIPPARTMGYVRTMFTQYENHLWSLEALGENVDTASIRVQLEDKFPLEFKRILKAKQDDQKWTVKELREGIKRLIKIHCDPLNPLEPKSNPATQAWSQGRKEEKPVPIQRKSTTASLVAHGKNPPHCAFCKEQHYSDECKKYETIDDRKSHLKDLCFICLKAGHRAKDCRNTKPCYYCKEKGKHHCSLCPKGQKSRVGGGAPANGFKDTQDEQAKHDSVLVAIGEQTLLQTATAQLYQKDSGSASVQVRILLDPAASQTYIKKSIADKLHLKVVDTQYLAVHGFGGNSTTTKYDMVDAYLELSDGKKLKLTANVEKEIAKPLQRSIKSHKSITQLLKKYKLADATLATESEYDIELLIGNDYWWKIVIGGPEAIDQNMCVIQTKLGYVLSGTIPTDQGLQRPQLSMLTISQPFNAGRLPFQEISGSERTQYELQDLWDLEKMGMNDHMSQTADQKALENFDRTLQFQNGRYEVTWPYKDPEVTPPNNYQLAKKRLNGVWNRLTREPELMKKYDAIIKDQIDKSIIEKVENDQSKNSETKVHYLAHHPVITPQKTTTKVRIVYDGSAKAQKTDLSLNECLHRGPVLLEEVCHLLMRFRKHKIALTADIEKAFLQVGLQKSERDVTRFLWIKDLSKPPRLENIQEYRFQRVPFGIISSPFLLAATVRHHLNLSESDVAKKIVDNIYVDNVITGCESLEEAQNFYKEAKKIFDQASMNLREWNTNGKELKAQIPAADKEEASIVKVLGINWNVDTDTLSIRVPQNEGSDVFNKRQVLSFVHQSFDPLGLISPVYVRIKAFLQSLWKEKLDWDQTLNERESIKFKQLKDEITMARPIDIPRWIGLTIQKEATYELHAFCDASTIAYATAIYIRETSNQGTNINLIFTKFRLAPMRKITIPRLELLAMEIGTKAVKYVENGMGISIKSIVIWSDSQCVLHWLRSIKPLSVFVTNRIQVIKSLDKAQFRYVNTKDNPADLATRGRTPSELEVEKKWWEGPSWLRHEESSWPINDLRYDDGIAQAIAEEESKKAKPIHSAAMLVAEGQPDRLDPSNFSNLRRLLRVTAQIFKFTRKCRKRDTSVGCQLDADDIKEAEVYWIKQEQKYYYGEELAKLEKGIAIRHGNIPLILKEGLICCQGRFKYAPISEEAKEPILLAKQSAFTKLKIKEVHKELKHAGCAHTLSEIRQRFWIPAGRAQVFKQIQQCLTCQRMDGGPFRAPIMPPLPAERVQIIKPFACIGVDYLGPVLIKDRVKESKRWICLFTCSSTRAIHLELVDDLTAESFLVALRMFIARRGSLSCVWSDNGKQFTAQITQDFAADQGITWKRIPERAPWMGGFYERLIGIVKRAIIKSVGSAMLYATHLRLLLAEIEAATNSRPLLPVESGIEGSCLTPNHFLFPGQSKQDGYIPPTHRILKENWKRLQRQYNLFIELWKREYLTTLRERHKIELKQGRKISSISPKIGQVVQVKSDNHRQLWITAIITELIKSKDGQIRSAKVRLGSGNEITRPIAALYPLELDEFIGGECHDV
jgi:hypothetical protein